MRSDDGGAAVFAEVEAADMADVGQAHELGHLRADLSGLAVGAVAAADDEVGLLTVQGQGQGAGGRQRVAASQRPVGDQYAPVCAQGEAFSQPLGSAGWAHGQHHNLVFRGGLQFHRPYQAENVEGV